MYMELKKYYKETRKTIKKKLQLKKLKEQNKKKL